MRRPGLTFIELIVILAILALLATFVIPTFDLILNQLELNTAISQVQDLLRLTEQRTVTEQKNYYVSFNTGGQIITQYVENTSGGSDQVVSTITLPSSIVVDSLAFGGATTVRFATTGAPSVSGSLVLLDTGRIRHRKIDVRPSGSVVADGSEY